MLCAIMFFQKIVSFMYLDELKKKSCKSAYTPTTEEQDWLPNVEFQFLILHFSREIIISLSGLVSSFNVCEKKTTLEILKLKLPIPECWYIHLLNHSGFLNLQANKIYWQNCPCSPICVIELQIYSCLSFGNNYTHTHTHNYIASLLLKINRDLFIKPQWLFLNSILIQFIKFSLLMQFKHCLSSSTTVRLNWYL